MLHLLTQLAVTYSYSSSDSQGDSGSTALSIVLIVIGVALLILMLASTWRVFTKAGKPGWASLIPIYNTYVLLKIVGKPGWWLILCLIPLVNIIVSIMVYYELAKCFGKDVGFLILLILVPMIAYPLLAFGDAKYHAPDADGSPSSKKSDGPTAPGGVSGNPAPPQVIS